jgi:hypothetical protein
MFPPAHILGPDGRPWHSWRVLVLPFIEQHQLFKQYKFDEPWDGPNNRELADRIPKGYSFPDTYRAKSGVANYLAIVGPGTMWPGAKPFQGDVQDGSSETILIAENHGLDVHWMEPRDFDFTSMSFELQRPDGISSRYKQPAAGMVDGTLRSFAPGKLSADALRAMITANGGEKLAETAEGWTVLQDGSNRDRRE